MRIKFVKVQRRTLYHLHRIFCGDWLLLPCKFWKKNELKCYALCVSILAVIFLLEWPFWMTVMHNKRKVSSVASPGFFLLAPSPNQRSRFGSVSNRVIGFPSGLGWTLQHAYTTIIWYCQSHVHVNTSFWRQIRLILWFVLCVCIDIPELEREL